MNQKIKQRLKRIAVATITLYVLVGFVLYFVQDKILFHPKALSKDYPFQFEQPFEELNISLGKENLSIIKFKSSKERKGIVLFFHGNMKNVEHYKKYPQYFLRNRCDVWMIDYPGFGKTTGKRSEKIIYEQALMMYNLAEKEIHYDSIIVYGKSIGTGIASYVAANKNCRQLILETPYYSIQSIARHYFPVYPLNSMIKYSFPVNNYLKEVKAPVIILHGTNDKIVPYKQSKRLKKENRGIHLITIEKGKHNDLSDFALFHSTIDSLLKY